MTTVMDELMTAVGCFAPACVRQWGHQAIPARTHHIGKEQTMKFSHICMNAIALCTASTLFSPVALAQGTQEPVPTPITTPAPTSPMSNSGAGNLDPRDERLLDKFQQQHPNWAQNHPKESQYMQNHPRALDRSLDKYGERQFGKNHPGWVNDHKGLARFDYNHPQWAENHPRKALGGGRRFKRGR